MHIAQAKRNIMEFSHIIINTSVEIILITGMIIHIYLLKCLSHIHIYLWEKVIIIHKRLA
jgi:hypothetical protein